MSRLRVLLVHNYYRQRAGEDASFAAEKEFLDNDPDVELECYLRDSREIDGYGAIGKARLGYRTAWSQESRVDLSTSIERFDPDIVHFHNTFPLVSPAAYRSCLERDVPVIQTIRNFRQFCSNGLLFRDGHVCEDCIGRRVQWPGVLHACYRSSRLQSAAVVAMESLHGYLSTWNNAVHRYIVPTDFVKQKLVQFGLRAERIETKADIVVPDPGFESDKASYGVYVGRLTREKGIWTLLGAWTALEDVPLKVIGEGPDLQAYDEAVAERALAGTVEVLGERSRQETLQLMRGAKFLVIPSEWYETYGRVAVEAFACGTPVVASRIGALKETIRSGATGLHFRTGDAEDLAEKVRSIASDQIGVVGMVRTAREEYETRYSPERLHGELLRIYRSVLRGREAGVGES